MRRYVNQCVCIIVLNLITNHSLSILALQSIRQPWLTIAATGNRCLLSKTVSTPLTFHGCFQESASRWYLKPWRRNNMDHQFFLQLSSSLSSDSVNLDRQYQLLQNLKESFDRWRFLQKLLDDDITNADDIHFILTKSIEQRYQSQRTISAVAHQPPSTSDQVESITADTEASTRPSNDNEEIDDQERRKIMETILRQLSSTTICSLLQWENDNNSSIRSGCELQFLRQLEQLLPNPNMDEDASKGLWDTVIELHGRESVKYNEQHNTMNWKTRCLVARVLIYYDFLSMGLPSS
jgi:hypothetical protein